MMLKDINIIEKLQKVFFRFQYRQETNITTHLTQDEKFEMYRLAKKCGGEIFVEIGSYLGASSCFIAAGIKKSRKSAKLFCIDTWLNHSMSEGDRDTFDEFSKNTLTYRDLIVPVRGFSTDVIPRARLQRIDFLFIDGGHSYEECRQDWELCRDLLSVNAIVVFHDIGWAEGVKRVVFEEVAPLAKKQKMLPNMWWAIIQG